ncbi:acyltransferase [Flavobacterium zhairuonense]|uniref:acyltransferase family protein n=1 Tax=Flavobacterium zhairuonense TaxID=2493631 RepID=UPI001042F4F3|nr:acyltransferase [Flavobacterium zhairuonense]KAF2512040.1 acyltransferase [Flavobacterium zhairuonense]
MKSTKNLGGRFGKQKKIKQNIMDRYLSNKIRLISFVAILMVVYIHSYNMVTKSLSGNIVINEGYSFFIQFFISQGLTRVAVPIFFSISGYLFFLNMKGSVSEFLIKFKKRIQTLVIPYLLWSIFAILLFYFLQSFAASKNFFTNQLIKDYSFSKLLHTIFLNPINYQLWFIRDLIVLVLISPIIFWSIKFSKFIIILLFFVAWMIDFNFVIFSSDSLLFFSFGAFISMQNNSLVIARLTNKKYLLVSVAWMILVLTFSTLKYNETDNVNLLNLLYKSSIICGIIAIWSLYDIILEDKEINNNKYFKITSFSFFIYAFHEPFLTILKKGLLFAFSKSDFFSLLVYFVAPLIIILISISVGYFLSSFFPKVYRTLTGGR